MLTKSFKIRVLERILTLTDFNIFDTFDRKNQQKISKNFCVHFTLHKIICVQFLEIFGREKNLRTIFKLKIKKPKKNFRKKMTHEEAVCVINTCEQNIDTHREYLYYNILPNIDYEIVNENNYERIVKIVNPDKTLIEVVKTIACRELAIKYAEKFITKSEKTLFGYVLPHKEHSKEYNIFLEKVLGKNRLSYIPFELDE